MDCVQAPYLGEPRTDSLHYSSAGLEAAAPVGFPFEEITWVEGVGAKFEDASEGPGRGGGPEREFLHEVVGARADEGWEGGGVALVRFLGGETVEGLMVAGIWARV